MRAIVTKASKLKGIVQVPGDKSLGHRAFLFAAAFGGETRILGVPDGEDVGRSREAARRLGCSVRVDGDAWVVTSTGPRTEGRVDLDCGNSGTTARLLLGILSGLEGQEFTLFGDASLSRRPMRRVAGPLEEMGASITLTTDGTLPAKVEGRRLSGRRHVLPVASAQVKSALLLAGCFADGETWVQEPTPSRDHTERWLPVFGVEVLRGPDGVGVRGIQGKSLGSRTLWVPGDPSSATFLAVAAALLDGGDVTWPGLGLNPTRNGAFEVLRRFGARVDEVRTVESPEPIGELRVRAGERRSFVVTPEEVPSLIDELPVLAVAAALGEGVSSVRGASELRVKESDRLRAIVDGLRSMGAEVQEFADGFDIHGGRPLKGATIDARMDHRIAMAFAVAGLVAEGETVIEGAEWAATSYPGFWRDLDTLSGGAVRLVRD